MLPNGFCSAEVRTRTSGMEILNSCSKLLAFLFLAEITNFCSGEKRWPDFSCFSTAKYRSESKLAEISQNCEKKLERLASCKQACILEKLDVWLTFGLTEAWKHGIFPNGSLVSNEDKQKAKTYMLVLENELGNFHDFAHNADKIVGNVHDTLMLECGPLLEKLGGGKEPCDKWKPIVDCFDKFGSCTGINPKLLKYYETHEDD